ncbi:MAG TPA: hypothetical protein VLB79_03515 [Solirubrobacterales bacterium]|nr:hypothetical protein [Solirubrobacterales bacterium]
MAPRKGIRSRLGRRNRPPSRRDELTELTRAQARAMSRRRRREARRQARREVRPQQDLGTRLRGAAHETSRRLRPLGAPVAGFFAWIGRPVSRALLFLVQLLGALIALVLEVGLIVVRRVGGVLTSGALIVMEATRRHVNPRSTVAFVGVCAAIGLGISQFFDYHGVAVDAPDYAGKIGAIAPVPITDRHTAGSAHLWILLPIAVLAVILMVAAYRGRPRLAAGVAACGLVGLAVAVAIDLPQGLDVGRPGLAFNGTEAKLLEGFWAEVACSAVLILCGGLLAHYSRGVTRERRRSQGRSGGAGRRAPRREAGGIYPGLQAEQ